MTKVPEKCSRCGAPISWDEGASIVKCDFCGYKNNLKNDFINFKVNKKIKEKINKIYLPAKKVLKNKYAKVILLSSLVSITGLFINKIINDPTRPYKVKIDDACKNISSNQSTPFIAKSTYEDCRKFFKNTIISLNNIERKGIDTKEYENSINELKDSENGIWGNSLVYSAQTSQGYKRVYFSYQTPTKYIKKRNNLLTKNIKKDCQKVDVLYEAIKELITQNDKNIASQKKERDEYTLKWEKDKERLVNPISMRFYNKKISWLNWNEIISQKNSYYYENRFENIKLKVKDIVSKNPTLINLDTTFQRDRYNPPTKKQCINDLSQKLIINKRK